MHARITTSQQPFEEKEMWNAIERNHIKLNREGKRCF